MGSILRLRDNLINFVSGLGTMKDPTTASQFTLNLMDQNVQETAYRSDWIARRIVDAPADDATREWRAWQASAQQIEKIEEVENKFRIQPKMRLALIKARLYGGAALVLGVEQGESWDELDYETVGADDLKFVVPLSCHELSIGPRNYDVSSPWYGRPEYYTINTPFTGSTPSGNNGDRTSLVTVPEQNWGGKLTNGGLMGNVHPSRVIEFIGSDLPSWHLSQQGGNWGDSVLQTCDEILRDFGMTVGGIANMVNDAKMDVVKIPDFSKNIATQEYSDRLLKRFTFANTSKSTINSLLLDKEEEWNRIQTNFGSLPQLINELMNIVAGAAGIPVSRLMGHAPGKSLGGSSGGEQDMRNYYDTIASQQRNLYAPALEPLDGIIIRSALGTFDPHIYYEWNPLWTPDPKEVAAIALQKAQVAQADVTMGLINEDALRRIRINQLKEDATYPGIEDAIDEFGEAPPAPKPGDANWQPTIDPKTGKPTVPPGGGGAPPPAPKPESGNQTTLKIVHSIKDERAGPFADAFDPEQPRDKEGKWASASGAGEKGARTDSLGKALPDHIPNIPPAWKDVQFNKDPNASLLVTGRDEKGRRVAIYSKVHEYVQAAAKFARIQELSTKYESIKKQNDSALLSKSPVIKTSAEVTKLIMETGIRPGSDKETLAKVQAYGATTLEGRHVIGESPSDVRLKFIGKKGVAIDIPVENKATAKMLLDRRSIAGSSKNKIFPETNSAALLDHVHSFDGGGFKTKDFRTLVANNVAMAEIDKMPKPENEKSYKQSVMHVAKIVSEKLGNTPVVALQSYINPALFAEWRMHHG